MDTPSLPHHRLIAFSVAKELLTAVVAANIRDAELKDQATRAAKPQRPRQRSRSLRPSVPQPLLALVVSLLGAPSTAMARLRVASAAKAKGQGESYPRASRIFRSARARRRKAAVITLRSPRDCERLR